MSASLNQFDLRRAINRDHSLSACDRACVGEIIDWHHADYGNAWICYDILVDKTGFSQRQVIRSVGRLLQKGYISLFAKGGRGVGARGRDGDKGRGGNRYQLNLSIGCKKGKAINLAAECSDIGVTANVEKCSDIDVRANQNALTSTSDQNQNTLTPVSDTHTYLDVPTRDSPTVGMYLSEEGTHAASPAGAPAGAAGAARDPVVGGFEELWKAYPRQFQKPDARKSYTAKVHDAETHAAVMAGARAMTAHIAANGGDLSKCPYLANWIDGERWDEDPAHGYIERKLKAPKAKGKPATTTTPAAEIRRDVSDAEKMRRVAEYARATNDTVDGLREVFGEHDEDLYANAWEHANLDWPDDVPAPSWVHNGGRLPDWTDSEAWADLTAKIGDNCSCFALERRVQLAGGSYADDEIYLPAELAGHPALADIIRLAHAHWIDVHVGDVVHARPTPATARKATPPTPAAPAEPAAAEPQYFNNPNNQWLRKQVANDKLSVAGAAQILGVSEEVMQRVVDGRATFIEERWSQLKSAALTPPTPPAEPPTLPKATPAPPAPGWANHAAWTARLHGACSAGERRAHLREWVKAAGGWSDGVAIYLPSSLPSGLALAAMKDFARVLGLDVRTTVTTGPFTPAGPFTRAPASP